MKIEIIEIDKLKPYEKNAKQHPKKQIELLKKNIEKFGFTTPILIDDNNEIIAGHGRLQAIKELNFKTVECVRMSGLTKTEIKALRLADNKIAEMGEWTMDLVIDELKELAEEEISLTGFDSDLIIEPEDKDEEVPEIPVEPKAKLGDIYQLGEHRIMCGDATKREDVERLMNGKKADMAFNDPPYGMKKEKEGVKNDNLNYDKLLEFNKKWISIQFDFLKDNGSWYCWGTDEPLMDIYSEIIKPLIKEQKATFRNLITWDKGSGQGQLSEDFRMYPIADEKCLFVMLGVQGFNINSDNYFEGWEPIRTYLLNERKKCGWDIPTMKTIAGHSYKSRDHWTSKSQWSLLTEETYNKFRQWAINNGVKAFEKEYDEIKKEYDEIKKEYYSTRAYFDNTHDNQNNVWHFSRAVSSERLGGHATPKPIDLCSRAIKSSSRKNEIVLDLFLGSGSTLIASEKTGRICYGMELDPKYIDVIIQRWENYTGKKAIKL